MEALSGEREALWARLDKATFLTVDEKRAAVGYAPLPREASDAPPAFGGAGVKFNPDQPRAPADNPGGGQWTDGGGGNPSGRARVAQAEGTSDRLIDLAKEEESGGHTIAEHVGKSDEALVRRMYAERYSIGAYTVVHRRNGSFPSLEAANKLVSSTLAQNQETVDLVASGAEDDAFVTAAFSSPTGREAYATSDLSQPYMRVTYGVGVFIVHNPKIRRGYNVISAFPRND